MLLIQKFLTMINVNIHNILSSFLFCHQVLVGYMYEEGHLVIEQPANKQTSS